jgi:hypothetical protein
MRAQLRTYHSIPSLQAHQDPNAYKQLQDAPRLKSILKGATEDNEQPGTVEDIKNHPIPRTNPVNLIFVLSQYAPKISELHFFAPRDFFDLVMRSNLSSRSRATAFLWLMWWYLESDFSTEMALNNPFGPGLYGPENDPVTATHPIKCPAFVVLTPEQVELENVDTPDEQVFGEIKRKERIAILASDMAPVVTGPKRSNKKGKHCRFTTSGLILALDVEADIWPWPRSLQIQYPLKPSFLFHPISNISTVIVLFYCPVSADLRSVDLVSVRVHRLLRRSTPIISHTSHTIQVRQ